MKTLEGRTAVITGAAQGIGYAIAEKFIQEKVTNLAVLDWNAEAIEKAAKTLSEIAPTTKVLAVQCDISNTDSVDAAFKKVEEELAPVDILVNNAGITRDTMFHKMTFEQWDSVMKVNVYGTYNCCRAVIQGMRDRNYGRIINMASTSAYGNAGQVNYAATKGAMISMTKALAKEGARKNICVNAIAPHSVNTAMFAAVPPAVFENVLKSHAMQRLGNPSEIAALAAFLANEEASYVSGTCIDCSGADRT